MSNEEFIKRITLEGEEWKDIIGFDGRYMISNHGRTVSLSRKVCYGNGKCRTTKPRILKNMNDKNGYITVTLTKDNYDRPYYVHRLIAEAFIPNPNNHPQVDHINGNFKDNSINNLRWCSMRENLSYPQAYKNLCESMKKVSENWIPATPKPIVGININNNEVRFYNKIQATKEDGFKPSSVSRCCRHKTRQHKGFTWMYLSDYKNLINKSKNSSPKGIND